MSNLCSDRLWILNVYILYPLVSPLGPVCSTHPSHSGPLRSAASYLLIRSFKYLVFVLLCGPRRTIKVLRRLCAGPQLVAGSSSINQLWCQSTHALTLGAVAALIKARQPAKSDWTDAHTVQVTSVPKPARSCPPSPSILPCLRQLDHRTLGREKSCLILTSATDQQSWTTRTTARWQPWQ